MACVAQQHCHPPLTAANNIASLGQPGQCPISTRWRHTNERTDKQKDTAIQYTDVLMICSSHKAVRYNWWYTCNHVCYYYKLQHRIWLETTTLLRNSDNEIMPSTNNRWLLNIACLRFTVIAQLWFQFVTIQKHSFTTVSILTQHMNLQILLVLTSDLHLTLVSHWPLFPHFHLSHAKKIDITHNFAYLGNLS